MSIRLKPFTRSIYSFHPSILPRTLTSQHKRVFFVNTTRSINVMAVPPKFAGQILDLSSSSSDPHTLELYLDYVCPFSAKLFNTVYDSVVPLVKSSFTTPGVRFVLRQQIQPWHPSSTLVHEAGAAVLRLKPDAFWEFSKLLFAKQKEYFDVSVVNETRNRTYERLAKLAAQIDGIQEMEVYNLLVISDKPAEDGGLNSGNKVTDDVKFMVKANRVTGVHVTPSVLFNGVMEGGISSSWTKEQWQEWLEKNVK